ncbi:CGP-CTERM sorting domain-containing protein [Thermococcus sp.]
MPKHAGLLLVAVLAIAVVASGCVSVEEHVKVSSGGKIELLQMNINMSKDIYMLLLTNTTEGSFCGDFKENLTDYESKHFTCEEHIKGETATITITGKNIDPSKLTGDTKIKIERNGDYIEFWDYTWYNESESKNESKLDKDVESLFTLDYYLEMPGDIVDSNAQVVNGNKAEWHWNLNTASKHPIYAKAKVEEKGICGPALLIGLTLLPVALKRR